MVREIAAPSGEEGPSTLTFVDFGIAGSVFDYFFESSLNQANQQSFIHVKMSS